MGLLAGLITDEVWLDGEDMTLGTKLWRRIWLAPFDLAAVGFNYFIGDGILAVLPCGKFFF
ncbi:hypothetical protein D5R40_30845 [Okeania hirsuta]|uniref:Uncharacterized protein n=1 Tax=Okeania hirsuta TaxID=1458930 RepID=A0A3N6PCT0_9CYAN|nr:hypothetical protein D5R40_30845 [Okeania hirsuta]